MSRLHRLVFGEGGESMSGGEAERIRKMAAYCGAFWHHGDDIVDAWEDGGSELRPPVPFQENGRFEVHTVTYRGTAGGSSKDGGRVQLSARPHQSAFDKILYDFGIKSTVSWLAYRGPLRMAISLLALVHVFFAPWVIPFLIDRSGIAMLLAIVLWWDVRASAVALVLFISQPAVPDWASLALGIAVQNGLVALEQYRVRGIMYTDRWISWAVYDHLNGPSLETSPAAQGSHALGRRRRESLRHCFLRRFNEAAALNPELQWPRVLATPTSVDRCNSTGFTCVWLTLGSCIVLQSASTFATEILLPTVWWPISAWWSLIVRVVEGGGNAADSGPSAEAVAAPGASAGASDVLGDGARPTDFVLATQLSQLFDAVLPNQFSPMAVVFVAWLLSCVFFCINRSRDTTMRAHYIMVYLAKIFSEDRKTTDCQDPGCTAHLWSDDIETSEQQDYELARWDGSSPMCCHHKEKMHATMLVGPSLGSTLRKIEHSFIYFTPMLWMKVLVSEVLVNTFTLVCCIGMVIFCTTLKIVTLIWSTVLSILEGKVMVVLETILYFFEGRKAAAPEWIRWSNEKVWKPVARVVHYGLVGVGALTDVVFTRLVSPAVRVVVRVYKTVQVALSGRCETRNSSGGGGKRGGGVGGVKWGKGAKAGQKGRGGGGAKERGSPERVAAAQAKKADHANVEDEDEDEDEDEEVKNSSPAKEEESGEEEMYKRGQMPSKQKGKKKQDRKKSKGKASSGLIVVAQVIGDGMVDEDEFCVVGKGGKRVVQKGGDKEEEEERGREGGGEDLRGMESGEVSPLLESHDLLRPRMGEGWMLGAGAGVWGGGAPFTGWGAGQGGMAQDSSRLQQVPKLVDEEDVGVSFDEERIVASVLQEDDDVLDTQSSRPVMSDFNPMPLKAPRPHVPAKSEEGCVICWEGSTTHVLAPCGHKALCGNCADKLLASSGIRRCPMCRAELVYPFAMPYRMLQELKVFEVNDE